MHTMTLISYQYRNIPKCRRQRGLCAAILKRVLHGIRPSPVRYFTKHARHEESRDPPVAVIRFDYGSGIIDELQLYAN